MNYKVTVDYVTTATIVVEANSAEEAEEIVEGQFNQKYGIRQLMERMARNYPDGFSVEEVNAASDDVDADIRMKPTWEE